MFDSTTATIRAAKRRLRSEAFSVQNAIDGSAQPDRLRLWTRFRRKAKAWLYPETQTQQLRTIRNQPITRTSGV
jgi:hypothetical protein